MGWAYCGKVAGREVGYGIVAMCDRRGCDERIDRGLGYICGQMHHDEGSDEPGCGRYFCGKHLGAYAPTGTSCTHRGKRSWGKTVCQPLRSDDGVVWCACLVDHPVVWPEEVAA